MSKRDLMEEEESQGWLATYADLMSLLLVFFILLFSISTIQIERFKEVFTSVRFSLTQAGSTNAIIELPHEAPTERKPIQKEDVILPQTQENPEIQAVMQELSEIISTPELSKEVKVVQQDDRLHIRVNGHALFEPGSTDLSYEADPILEALVKVFSQHPEFQINIQGHTDNQPIFTDKFPSNWELSAVRATTVLRYFAYEGLDAKRFSATGFADSRPLTTNQTPEGRAENRRVEFVLERIRAQ
ncbi:OmpA/MotB family protein [Balneatrix alpica]|uniref:Flagellar motor protein MotB n=1 Tax=Balneatrix alpica TaxID=75684 RepID=A0ABV5ZEJ1_9GAMM|nr:flagellar motor protein MotB [Balneatrix alpica]